MQLQLVPPRERPTLPTYYGPLVTGVVIVATALPPSRYRIPLTLPIILFLCLNAIKYRSGEYFIEHYQIGFHIVGLLFQYIDKVLLANADKEQFHRLSDEEKRTGIINGEAPGSFRARLYWAACQYCVPRGEGWSYRVKNIPSAPPKGYPRWKFIAYQAFRITWFYVLVNTLWAFFDNATPHYRAYGSGKGIVGFESRTFFYRLRIMWLFILAAYSLLQLVAAQIYFALSVLCIYKPEECHPIFGDLRHCYSVRNCWSVTWHQLLRRIFTALGTFFSRDVFKFPKASFLSNFTQLFIAFFASGTMHHLVSVWAHPNAAWKEVGDFQFFMVQPLAIIAEDYIIRLGRKLGMTQWWWKLVGYTWTALWFGWSTAIMFGPSSTPCWWEHVEPVDFLGLKRHYAKNTQIP